jgi:hypothetical protein
MGITSGDVITQIANFRASWNVAIIIAVAVVGCWLLAECIHLRADRRRIKQRLAQSTIPERRQPRRPTIWLA